MTHADLVDRLRAKCAEAGSQAALARQIGVTRGLICGILTGRFNMTETVAEAIGLERVVIYREKQK